MNYRNIVDNIIKLKKDHLCNWERDFLDSVIEQDCYNYLNGVQKNKILEINRKYVARR